MKLIVRTVLFFVAVVLITPAISNAYPEFQTFSEKHSARTTNCAICHTNPAGPSGKEEGQIAGLTAADMEKLNRARGAMEPGTDVESPILNSFGNKILQTLGRKKFIELKENPAALASALGTKSDLDGDGIADGEEFLDGTDPLNQSHGDPWKLFWINADRAKVQIGMAIVSIVLLDYGFMQIIHGLAAVQKARRLRTQSQGNADD